MTKRKVKGLKISWRDELVVVQNDKEMMKNHMLGFGAALSLSFNVPERVLLDIVEVIAEDAADTFSHPKLILVNLDEKRIPIACVDESKLFGISREKVNNQGDYYVRSSENRVAGSW